MSAFFLTHDLPLEQIARGFSEQELDQAFTAMSRAHQAHGIERQVQKQELARVTMPFFTWFPDVIRGITKFVIHPEQLPKPSYFTKDQTLEILHAPEHAARLEQVRGYARTVAKVLRSTEAREISNRLRQTLARNPDLPSDQRLDSRAAGDAIQDLVVRKLIAVHPELGQYVVNFGGSTFFPAQPLALFFFQSISHPDTH